VIKFLLLISILCTNTYATPININNITDKEEYSGSLELSYNRQSGYKDKTEFSTEITSQYKSTKHLFFGQFNDKLLTNQGQEDGSKMIRHVRYRYYLPYSLGFETYAQREWDTNKELMDGMIYGAGPFVQLVDSPDYKAILGTAHVEEHELYLDYFEYEKKSRTYSYVAVSARVPGFFKVQTLFHSENNINKSSDYRVYNISTLKFRSVHNISFGLNYQTSYANIRSTQVVKKNSEVTTTLGIDF